MIFKVYYQESASEVPVREMTKTLYVEGESKREVIRKISERNHNIQFVEEISGNYLNYEKQNEDFKVLEL
ncbi:DNA-dependent RNA polymerase subunit epsilon [Peribacillus kribbensis]|uniref:DNA-dependent RNA polymerase subunit epsilon n=1 Tax=Peribacillus kribbensis TaxID=356658 RepID=UPI0004063045|nr:DNA-directed RNA polymerase subunit epsilon [Peribacillus kribbensis]